MAVEKPELIIALDGLNESQALNLSEDLQKVGVRWFKVGLELFTKSGPEIVKSLKGRGNKIFLDLKLYDIPNTVEKAVSAAVETGADLLTVHASGGLAMLKAAAKASRGSSLKILAVTILTSFSDDDFLEIAESFGLPTSSKLTRYDAALSLSKITAASGVSGIVCSVPDLLLKPEIKEQSWKEKPLFVTPGIRMPEDEKGDQSSIATPATALKAGSTHLVVGRPVTAPRSKNPSEAAQIFLKQLESGNH